MREEKVKWFHRSGLGCDPVAMHGAPVSFTAEGTGLLPGKNMVLNQTALASGYRTPYFLDEIRMQVFMGSASVTSLVSSFAAAFQFRADSHAFSNVPIPMSLYQPQYNNTSQQLLANYVGGTLRRGTTARWLLAKPLWMAPGSTLQADVFRHLTAAAGDGTNPFTVVVTYVGRALPPGSKQPVSRHVPWAAFYTHDFANSYSETDVQSPFQNPFTRELMVHRFIGRPLSKATSGVSTTFRDFMLPNDLGVRYAAIDMWDSTGYRVVKGGGSGGMFVPVGMVFDPERCSWTFARPLGAREQYNMAFQTQGTSGGTDRLFCVSMLGTREET